MLVVTAGAVRLGVAASSAGNAKPLRQESPCATPAVNLAGSVVPADVDAGCHGAAFFQDYSWRAFLAITRGLPRGLEFESYAPHWHIFRGGERPNNWGETAATTPCRAVTAMAGDLVLSSHSEIEDLEQLLGPDEISGPLIAQNRTYIRYGIGYNAVAFAAMRDQGLYLSSRLGSSTRRVEMPVGSIAVKSAWLIINAQVPHPERFYRREAWVRRLGADSTTCDKQSVALIGLHIIQKTKLAPQWIWTSFEHIDNVPPKRNEQRDGPFTLHDDTTPAQVMPAVNPHGSTLPVLPQPANVIREGALSNEVVAANNAYRDALANVGSLWQHYQLVMTQWPRNLSQPLLAGGPGNSIPGTSATVDAQGVYANPAFETYFQTPITNSCMACHDDVRSRSDFLWTPSLHAWSTPEESTASDSQRRRLLEALARRVGAIKR